MRKIISLICFIPVIYGLTLLNDGGTYTSITPDTSAYYSVFSHEGHSALLLRGSEAGTSVVYELEGWMTLDEISSMRIGFEGVETGSGDGPTVILFREGGVSTLEGTFLDAGTEGWHEIVIDDPGIFVDEEFHFIVKFGFINMPMDTTEIWQVSVNLEFYDDECPTRFPDHLVMFYNPTTFESVVPYDSIHILDPDSAGWNITTDTDFLNITPVSGSGYGVLNVSIDHDACEMIDNGIYHTSVIITPVSECPPETTHT